MASPLPSQRTVGVNAWGWEPWGMPFYVGMAIHRVHDRSWRGGWSEQPPEAQAKRERELPNNLFVQNARRADELADFHFAMLALPCHDRPEWLCRASGSYGRPAGAIPQPHSAWAMGADL